MLVSISEKQILPLSTISGALMQSDIDLAICSATYIDYKSYSLLGPNV